MPQTPRELGYRMPAEWHPHAATWLSWPRREGISFPDRYDEVLPTLVEMVGALVPHEAVNINVGGVEFETQVRQLFQQHRLPMESVRFHHIPTNEPWCR